MQFIFTNRQHYVGLLVTKLGNCLGQLLNLANGPVFSS